MADRINVKELRRSMGLTLEDLADRLGIHTRTIQRWEAGDVKPSPLAIRQLRQLQRPSENPRRRDYEPQSQSEPPTPTMGSGIIPSRRMAE